MRWFEILKEDHYDLIQSFKDQYDYWDYGQIRDHCGIISADFKKYCDDRNISCQRVSGYFETDNPCLSLKSFKNNEIFQMKQAGYDIHNENDRRAFAIDNNLIEELKNIPHYWNVVSDGIIDLSGYSQFVKTHLSSDLSVWRYHN